MWQEVAWAPGPAQPRASCSRGSLELGQIRAKNVALLPHITEGHGHLHDAAYPYASLPLPYKQRCLTTSLLSRESKFCGTNRLCASQASVRCSQRKPHSPGPPAGLPGLVTVARRTEARSARDSPSRRGTCPTGQSDRVSGCHRSRNRRSGRRCRTACARCSACSAGGRRSVNVPTAQAGPRARRRVAWGSTLTPRRS